MLKHDVHVRVGDIGWIDDVTKPGTARPHAPGTWLLLPVPIYRRLRLARVEEVERVLVRREWRGRPYLHAITLCGRFVGEWAGKNAERVEVPVTIPVSSYEAPRQDRRLVQYVVRRGCGCGGRRQP